MGRAAAATGSHIVFEPRWIAPGSRSLLESSSPLRGALARACCWRGDRAGVEFARRTYEACAGAGRGAARLSPALPRACAALESLLEASGRRDVTRRRIRSGSLFTTRKITVEPRLEASGGPFVLGAEMSAADCLLLPLLERCEACVPYFYGDDAFGALPFARARRMLEVRRVE